MPQAREIKRRIKSVEDTKQITRAMKMVAAAKLRRAQMRMLAMRPYAERLGAILAHVARDLFGDEHPLFRARPAESKAAAVVIAGDKGLCGGFNTNIVRHALQHFREREGLNYRLYSIGKRATSAFRKRKLDIVHSYTDVFDSLSYHLAGEICDQLVTQYLDGTIDSACVIYNRFVTVVSQDPTVERLLPLDFASLGSPEAAESKEARALYEFEPDPEAAVARLVGRLVATRLYRATLESYAAELGARMTAMDNATNNAEDMIDKLTMQYNRARQTGITAELLDIVGGAEGLKG